MSGLFFLLVALQKTPSLLGAECRGVGTTPLHANERGQTVRFVAVIEPPVYWGISIDNISYKIELVNIWHKDYFFLKICR